METLGSGCCGMAGSFGYERGDRYEVSVGAGERILLPAVRRADPDAMIMTSGFSCRQQIEQLTDRRALHLAQVLQRGLQNREPAARTDASPARVRGLSSSGRSSPGGRLRRLALAAAGVAAGGLLAVHLGGRKSE